MQRKDQQRPACHRNLRLWIPRTSVLGRKKSFIFRLDGWWQCRVVVPERVYSETDLKLLYYCDPQPLGVHLLKREYTNFFEGRVLYTQYKKRSDDQSAEYTRSAFTWKDNQLSLAKMSKPLAIVWSRPLPEGAT